MKKIIIGCLLAASGASALAEWTRLGEGMNASNYYIDVQGIRKDGNLSKVWLIQNLKQRDTSGEMSVLTLKEYDCNEERHRTLAISTHSEVMATGVTLLNGNPKGDWQYIPPKSVAEFILKIVCAK